MAQQPPSFQPDTDNRPPSFVPDSFVPDEPESGRFISGSSSKERGPRPLSTRLLERLFTGFDQETREEFAKRGVTNISGQPEAEVSLLPDIKFEPETWTGGFLKSLYKDYVQPLATPSGIIGSSGPKIPKTPPKPRIAGLLPEGRDPLIAGPIGNPLGQVARASEVTPDKAAQISGAAIPSKGDVIPPAVDLGELREKSRLENLYFTGTEQVGGKRLDVPYRIPHVQAGDTRLGFESVSRADDLPYPLNIAPEAVRPRAIQTITDALAAERTVPSPTTGGKTVNINESSIDDFVKGLSPEPYVPPALPSAREVLKSAQNLGVPPQGLSAAIKNPVIGQAAAQVIKEDADIPRNPVTAVYTELRNYSPDLYAKSFRAVHQERQYKARWIPIFQNAINRLSKTEKQNFGGYVEGSIQPPSDAARNAVEVWKRVADEMGAEAERVGLRLFVDSKNWIPFKRNPNYWPHILPEGTSPKDLVSKLMEEGMTRAEAQRVAAHWRKTGEIINPAQRARTPGYKLPYLLDVDSGIAHLRSMSRRIAQHVEFGPRDIKGKGTEGIADLIEGSSNPKRAEELMERLLGRGEKDDEGWMKVLNAARKYSTITKLQNFTLPNIILGNTTNAVMARRAPIEAMEEVSKLLTKSGRSEMAKAGVWQDFARSITEEIKPGVDWYGIGAGEAINRGIGGAVGRGIARNYFRRLKDGTGDAFMKRELFELLGENVDDVLKQKELTESQLRMAAGRTAERTQGLNVPGNMPLSWSKPVKSEMDVAVQSALIFKKMAYQATRTLWDQVKNDPVRTIPAWLVAAQIGGELTGDVKAGLRGMWSGDPMTAFEQRGSYWLEGTGIAPGGVAFLSEASGVEPELIARLFDNYMQAFFLGLPFDLVMSSGYGPSGLVSAVAGPVAGDISRAAYRGARGDLEGTAKDVVRSLPIPGSSGLVESLFEEE